MGCAAASLLVLSSAFAANLPTFTLFFAGN
jgi:hypothetical protein